MHQKIIHTTLKIGFFIILFSSCYYDKADVLYPQTAATNCDTTNVIYANQISQIVNANCNNCHGASTANLIGGGINLSTYSLLKTYVDNGNFLNSILQNGKASPMPKNASKLDACSINKIQNWVNKGALNN
jgi:mono/diheme cytochrome c family protein